MALTPKIGKAAVALAIAVAMGITTAGVAAAASPPTAVTGPASSISFTTAALSGDVDAYGVASTWFFEYGTTPSYGLRTATTAAGADTHSVTVASVITGLTPGTTYHVRLVAQSSGGTAAGSDTVFRTAVLPPAITSESASSVHDSTTRIVAHIDPHGLATSWSVRYGTTPSYGATTALLSAGSAVGAGTFTTSLSKLVPNTAYHFDVVATNAAGTVVGPDRTVVTSGAVVIASTSLSALTTTSATLVGSLTPDGHTTSWAFQYGPTTAYGSTTPFDKLSATMSFVSVAKTISGLVPNTTYHARLLAKSADGSVGGADLSFTTPGPTIVSSPPSTDVGHSILLSGVVPDGLANQVVSLYAQPFGVPAYVEVATLLTGSGGAWAYTASPSVATTYKALWKTEMSPQLTVAVSPSVTLHVRPNGRFVTHVAGVRSFTGAVVRLQRLRHGTWHTIAARALNRNSSAAFRPNLPKGASHLRIYLTAYQAGAGYLAGFSATHLYRSV